MAQGGHAYFSNSFYVPEIPATWRGALGTHGVSPAFGRFRRVFRSKRNAVRIPEASNGKLKAPHRREREQAPHSSI